MLVITNMGGYTTITKDVVNRWALPNNKAILKKWSLRVWTTNLTGCRDSYPGPWGAGYGWVNDPYTVNIISPDRIIHCFLVVRCYSSFIGH